MPQPVSKRYLRLFNELAKEEGITWKQDANQNGLPDPEEVQLGAQWRKLNAKAKSARLTNTAYSIFSRVEERRRAAVQEALKEKYLKPYRFAWNPRALPEPVQQALPKFMEISELTEELQLLQLDPSGLEWMAQVRNGARQSYKPEIPAGDLASWKLFQRGYGRVYQFEGGCHRYTEDPFCDPVGSFPDWDPNSVMWADDIRTTDDLQKLAGHLQEALLMSPFTVVEKGPEGKFKITEYNQHPLFKSRLVRIAELFGEIAALPGFSGLEPDMAQTAVAYAQALERGQGPRFLDDAEITWAKARGRHIAFTWGPFEEPQDPHGIKRSFQFHLFSVRQEASEELEQFQQAVLQEMENRLAARVEGYEAANVSVPSVIQVYDVIERSGGVNNSGGEYLAAVIPNSGPVVEGGYRKKQIYANMNEGVFENVLRPLAARSIDPAQLKYVQPRFLTLGSTLHELSHSIGPTENQTVKQNGKEIPIKTAMGAGLFGALEEAKADVGGVWMYPLLRQKGLISEEDEKAGYVTFVANRLRSIRFGSTSPHGRGANAQLGYLFETGVVEFQEVDAADGGKETRLHVNLDKMPQAVEAMTVEIAAAQNQGSKEAAEQFLAHAEQIPQDWDKVFVPRFDDIPRHIKLEVQVQTPPPEKEASHEAGFNCGCNLGARP
ncbi:MAG: hypothetical protein HY609_02065 [Deltaproteobacteria bacterium]|nr:hypothetical protein [Deltaproteobacteria bacterium]MBI4223693.1 hypothetical protein [Deltaproteobacteria bacterium]